MKSIVQIVEFVIICRITGLGFWEGIRQLEKGITIQSKGKKRYISCLQRGESGRSKSVLDGPDSPP